jgi:hypothetical protein
MGTIGIQAEKLSVVDDDFYFLVLDRQISELAEIYAVYFAGNGAAVWASRFLPG